MTIAWSAYPLSRLRRIDDVCEALYGTQARFRDPRSPPGSFPRLACGPCSLRPSRYHGCDGSTTSAKRFTGPRRGSEIHAPPGSFPRLACGPCSLRPNRYHGCDGSTTSAKRRTGPRRGSEIHAPDPGLFRGWQAAHVRCGLTANTVATDRRRLRVSVRSRFSVPTTTLPDAPEVLALISLTRTRVRW